MLLALLVLLPAVAGVVAQLIPSVRVCLGILIAVAVVHLGLTAGVWLGLPAAPTTYLALDVPGRLFLGITSVLFLAVSVYAVPYVLGAVHDRHASAQKFVPCLCWFLAAMTLVTTSQHLALLWAAIEATTLASAPLIYFYKRKAALEATWKYLLICSVGIALALLGTFFLGIASGGRLTIAELAGGSELARPWLRAAFVLALVGYGTKMGLVPLHTWLPDAHSQAPSPVSALLSGALLNCAFLGILRFYQVCLATGDAEFARTLLMVFGLVSIGVAASLMVGQRDYKRLLAYSSVENMGVLAFGVGLGGAATYGAMLHAVNHSLTKAGLFMLAGNVLHGYHTTDATQVQGVLRRLPATGALLTIGMLAIGGSPPFGPFMSELLIFMSALHGGHAALAVLFVVLLAIAFLGMAGVLLPMLHGPGVREPEERLSLASPLVLGAAVAVLGVYVPGALSDVLQRAAGLLGGG